MRKYYIVTWTEVNSKGKQCGKSRSFNSENEAKMFIKSKRGNKNYLHLNYFLSF